MEKEIIIEPKLWQRISDSERDLQCCDLDLKVDVAMYSPITDEILVVTDNYLWILLDSGYEFIGVL